MPAHTGRKQRRLIFPSSLTVTPNPATLGNTAGNTVQLTANSFDIYGSAWAGNTYTWTSSDTSKMTVNGTGLVTRVAAGPSTITAKGSAAGYAATVAIS